MLLQPSDKDKAQRPDTVFHIIMMFGSLLFSLPGRSSHMTSDVLIASEHETALKANKQLPPCFPDR